MPTTTIKVPTELRDRVGRLARQRHLSQSAYLDKLLTEAEENEFWRRMAEVDAGDYHAAVASDGDEVNEDFGVEDAVIDSEES